MEQFVKVPLTIKKKINISRQ